MDTFYGPLSVCINGALTVTIYHSHFNFNAFLAYYFISNSALDRQEPISKLGQTVHANLHPFFKIRTTDSNENSPGFVMGKLSMVQIMNNYWTRLSNIS